MRLSKYSQSAQFSCFDVMHFVTQTEAKRSWNNGRGGALT